jgi:hypothetical protein
LKLLCAEKEPKVTESSSSRAVDLAKRLKEAGAKMYGAFWCSHCYEQKQSFGKEAMADLPYVECYPSGYYKVLNPLEIRPFWPIHCFFVEP